MGVRCEEVRRDLSDYIDGELQQSERTALELHLLECPQCTAVLASTRNVIQLYRDPRLFEMPSAIRQRLRDRLKQEVVPPRRQFLAWVLTAAATVPVAVALYSARNVLLPHGGAGGPAQRGEKLSLSSEVLVSEEANEKLFHIQGCAKLHGKQRQLTVREALDQGYSACPFCIGKNWGRE